jgi:hypothetical protein
LALRCCHLGSPRWFGSPHQLGSTCQLGSTRLHELAHPLSQLLCSKKRKENEDYLFLLAFLFVTLPLSLVATNR